MRAPFFGGLRNILRRGNRVMFTAVAITPNVNSQQSEAVLNSFVTKLPKKVWQIRPLYRSTHFYRITEEVQLENIIREEYFLRQVSLTVTEEDVCEHRTKLMKLRNQMVDFLYSEHPAVVSKVLRQPRRIYCLDLTFAASWRREINLPAI